MPGSRAFVRQQSHKLVRSSVTRAGIAALSILALHLGYALDQAAYLGKTEWLGFVLVSAALFPAAVITADPLPRSRENRMMLLEAALPLGSVQRNSVTFGLALVLSLASTAVLVGTLWLSTVLERGVALRVLASLVPVVVLGWGLGALVSGLAQTRIGALLSSTGACLVLLATTEISSGALATVGAGFVVETNPLTPAYASVQAALVGWPARPSPIPGLVGAILAGIGLGAARWRRIPR